MSIETLLKDIAGVEGIGYRLIETGRETIVAFRCLEEFNKDKVGADIVAPYVRHIVGQVPDVMPSIEEQYIGRFVRRGALTALGASSGGVGLMSGGAIAAYAGAGWAAAGIVVPALLIGTVAGIYVFDNQRTTHERSVNHLQDIAARCKQAYAADDDVFEHVLRKEGNVLAPVLVDAKRNKNPIKHNQYFFMDPVRGPSAP